MLTKKVNIIGCGGHAKVVLDAFMLSNDEHSISLWDNNPALSDKMIADFPIQTLIEPYTQLDGVVHVAIGNNEIRKKMVDNLPCLPLWTIMHPSVILAASVEVESGVFVAAYAILAPECFVGRGCIINHGAVVDHEVQIGAFSHIAPNATLGGNVKIGPGVLIGAGATVLPGIRIGEGSTIGAGAVVVQDVPANTLVKGVPAKVR